MKIIFSLLAFLFICLLSNSQTSIPGDSILQAKYLEGNFQKALQNTTTYPIEGIKNNIDGDVIVTLIITKEGKMDSITVVKTPDFVLTKSSVLSLNAIPEKWSPAMVNATPIDKKYQIVFRYRMYFNTQPRDYKAEAIRIYNNGKLEKALKAFNNAIEDNPYDYVLYKLRAEVKERLSDGAGAKQDLRIATDLQNSILATVKLDAVGMKRTESSRTVNSSIQSRY